MEVVCLFKKFGRNLLLSMCAEAFGNCVIMMTGV